MMGIAGSVLQRSNLQICGVREMFSLIPYHTDIHMI